MFYDFSGFCYKLFQPGNRKMNPASSESKGVCMYCREHLIFASARTGQKTICPHCNRETILLPSIKPPVESPPSSPQIKPAIESEKPLLFDPDWAARTPNTGSWAIIKGFVGLFYFIFALIVGAFLLFGFVVLLRFLHAAWGY